MKILWKTSLFVSAMFFSALTVADDSMQSAATALPQDATEVKQPVDPTLTTNEKNSVGELKEADGMQPKQDPNTDNATNPADGMQPDDGTQPVDAAPPTDGTPPTDEAK